MATPKDKYYNALLDNLFKDDNSKGEPLSNDQISQSVGKVIEEMEAQFERNINKITCDTSFQYSKQNKDLSTIKKFCIL